ncbi:MAG: PqqD family protein [Clostridia bacterium]|nr:PqqD family protein [Clostridia bacterium]
MKIKNEFILKTIGENTPNEINVVIAVGKCAKNISGYAKISDSGVLLWNKLKNGADKEALINLLLSEYDVMREIAEKDVDAFIQKLNNIGALIDD